MLEPSLSRRRKLQKPGCLRSTTQPRARGCADRKPEAALFWSTAQPRARGCVGRRAEAGFPWSTAQPRVQAVASAVGCKAEARFPWSVTQPRAQAVASIVRCGAEARFPRPNPRLGFSIPELGFPELEAGILRPREPGFRDSEAGISGSALSDFSLTSGSR